MITLKKICYLLFFTGLFFFPFNSFQGIKALGEYQNEAGAFFFLSGFFLLVIDAIKNKRISIPYNNIIFQILMLFLAWCCISTLLNFSEVSTNFFKKTNGISRFVRQFISLLFSSFIFVLFFWNMLRGMSLTEILYKIRKIFLWTLVAASIYGFFEILRNVFGISAAYKVLEVFNYFPFLEFRENLNGRISSISFEPPFFAVYLISIAGWMFSYMLTESKDKLWKYIPGAVVLVLTYYSGSRTGLVVVTIQLVVFLSIYLSARQKRLALLSVAGFVGLMAVVFTSSVDSGVLKDISKKIESLDFSGNLETSISNQSRFGIQYASIMVFLDHPIAGAGFGPQAYSSRYYYPRWAKKNNWEFKYIYEDPNVPSFPPGYNMYTRLLAETGLVGILIFFSLIFVTIYNSRKLLRNGNPEMRTLGIILLITFTGLYINWGQIDTFRVYLFWLSLCILMRISVERQNNPKAAETQPE